MARPTKRYRIRVRGRQRKDIDADLLMQALLLMAEEAQAAQTDTPLSTEPESTLEAPKH